MTDFIVEDSADPLERNVILITYECSECHTASECRSNYCQQCGAYMMSREAAG